MIGSLIPTLIFLLAVLIVMIFAKIKLNSSYLMLFVIAVSYTFLLNLPREYPLFQLVNSRWNWSGKIYVLFFSVLCVVFLKSKLPIEKVGLTAIFKPGSFKPALIFTGVYLLIICGGSFFFQGKLPHSMDKQDILWNTAVLPDFSEEFMERGILLVLLNDIFKKNWIFFGAKIGPGLIFICLLFGLEHGLSVDNSFQFNFAPFHFFRTVFISGLVFTWLKERTGNLILPTVAHAGTEMILAMMIVFYFSP